MNFWALLAAIPGIVGWGVFMHFMNISADRATESVSSQLDQRTPLSDGWESRWTLRGALLGAGAVAAMFAVLYSSGAVSWPTAEKVASASASLLVCTVIGALGGAGMTHRQIRLRQRATGGES